MGANQRSIQVVHKYRVAEAQRRLLENEKSAGISAIPSRANQTWRVSTIGGLVEGKCQPYTRCFLNHRLQIPARGIVAFEASERSAMLSLADQHRLPKIERRDKI